MIEYKDNIKKYEYEREKIIKKIQDFKEIKFDYLNSKNYFDKLNRVIITEFIEKIIIGKLENNIRKIEIKWNI